MRHSMQRFGLALFILLLPISSWAAPESRDSTNCGLLLDYSNGELFHKAWKSGATVSFRKKSTLFSREKQISGTIVDFHPPAFFTGPTLTIQQDYGVDESFGLTKVQLESIEPNSLTIHERAASAQLSAAQKNLLQRLQEAQDKNQEVFLKLLGQDKNPNWLDNLISPWTKGPYGGRSLRIQNIRLSSDGATYIIDLFRDDFESPWYFSLDLKQINPGSLRSAF